MSRDDRFGAKPPGIELAEVTVSPSIEPIEDIWRGKPKDEIVRKILSQQRWRYDHGIPELAAAEDRLYRAYVDRVDTMLDLIDAALEEEGLSNSLGDKSIVDLACAEGFVAMHLLKNGASNVDCFDLNLNCLERLHLVKNYFGYSGLSTFRLDFENCTWSSAFSRKYDVVFCLGIVYHMENPILFLRNVFELTGGHCIVESDTPVSSRSSGALVPHDCQVTKDAGDVRYVLELRPSLKALADMLLAVGFRRVRYIKPPESTRCDSLGTGRKSVLICEK